MVYQQSAANYYSIFLEVKPKSKRLFYRNQIRNIGLIPSCQKYGAKSDKVGLGYYFGLKEMIKV